MTYSESDYPGLINIIDNILNRDLHPLFKQEAVKEVIRTYRRVPVYPGIATACAYKIIEQPEITEVNPGDTVLLKTKEQDFFGTVLENTGEDIKIGDSVSVPVNLITGVFRIKKDVLEEDWPTLIFPEPE